MSETSHDVWPLTAFGGPVHWWSLVKTITYSTTIEPKVNTVKLFSLIKAICSLSIIPNSYMMRSCPYQEARNPYQTCPISISIFLPYIAKKRTSLHQRIFKRRFHWFINGSLTLHMIYACINWCPLITQSLWDLGRQMTENTLHLYQFTIKSGILCSGFILLQYRMLSKNVWYIVL